jgi:hypothetical protein
MPAPTTIASALALLAAGFAAGFAFGAERAPARDSVLLLLLIFRARMRVAAGPLQNRYPLPKTETPFAFQ